MTKCESSRAGGGTRRRTRARSSDAATGTAPSKLPDPTPNTPSPEVEPPPRDPQPGPTPARPADLEEIIAEEAAVADAATLRVWQAAAVRAGGGEIEAAEVAEDLKRIPAAADDRLAYFEEAVETQTQRARLRAVADENGEIEAGIESAKAAYVAHQVEADRILDDLKREGKRLRDRWSVAKQARVNRARALEQIRDLAPEPIRRAVKESRRVAETLDLERLHAERRLAALSDDRDRARERSALIVDRGEELDGFELGSGQRWPTGKIDGLGVEPPRRPDRQWLEGRGVDEWIEALESYATAVDRQIDEAELELESLRSRQADAETRHEQTVATAQAVDFGGR